MAFYKDLQTGEFIDEWDNPLNGKRVETFPIHNMIVNATLAPVMEMDIEGTMLKKPFTPPWMFVADHAFFDFRTSYVGTGSVATGRVAGGIARTHDPHQRDVHAHVQDRGSS